MASTEHAERRTALLLDFYNFYPRPDLDQSTAWVGNEINRMVTAALAVDAATTFVDIRLYGGWIEDGLLTRDGSALQAAVATANPFPLARHDGHGILRGEVTLVTRLISVPLLEWGHTRRTAAGLPQLRLADSPLPSGCAGSLDTCPLRAVYRLSRRRARQCHVSGCTVSNEDAFKVVEQKMVDVLICSDALAFAVGVVPRANVVILSDDLDLVPAVAMAAEHSQHAVELVRSRSDRENLYGSELAALGVGMRNWDQA
jgi:hypothetical protein